MMGDGMVKLPVFDVLGRAFTAPFKFAWPLLPFYIVAAGFALGMIAFWFQVAGPMDPAGASQSSDVGSNVLLLVLLVVVAYLIFLSVAVLTHRLAADIEHPWQLIWPVLKYFFVGLGLGLIGLIYYGGSFLIVLGAPGAVPTEPGADVGMGALLVFAVIVLLGIAIGAHLFLALPAAALGRKGTLALALRVSRGNTLRLFSAWILYFILMIAINAASFLVVGGTNVLMQNPEMAPGGMLGAVGAGWLIVNVVVNYYVTVAGAAFLTYSLIALLPNDADVSAPEDAAT